MTEKNNLEGRKRKSLVLLSTAGGDNMQVQQTDVPDVLDDQILIRVKACGLNFAECAMRQGIYRPMPQLPCVIGYECAGVIEEVGNKVDSFKIGQHVIGLSLFGAWHEIVVLSSSQCLEMPDGMSFQEAAALPVNYLTAYLMLFNQGALRDNQKVLVHMAAGGVGTAVAQLCKTVPNVEVFGTASAAKHEYCISNGITYPIDYTSKDYVQEVRSIAPEGIDLVLDPLAGTETWRAYELLKPFGKIITFGASKLVTGENRSIWSLIKGYFTFASFGVTELMKTSKCVGGFHLGVLMQNPAYHYLVMDAMKNLLILYKDKKIKPVIDSTHSFDQIKQAMGRIYDRKNVGKVILIP